MSDIVVNITPPAPISLSYTQGGAVGPQGATGSTGPVGPTNRLVLGSVTSGTAASATISAQTVANGTATQTLNLVLPQGATGSQGIQGVTGPAGPVNVLSVGSVATTSATTASVSITGTASQVISFVIPRGQQGDAGPYTTIKVGGVTTGAAGTAASVESVTSGGTVTLSFTIPRGLNGDSNLADETPQPLGVASVGSALRAARADHVHSTPTIAFGSLTGVPVSFSPSAHTHAVSDVANLQAALDSKQPAGSYATLVNGAVPSSMLPGYVDDIIEYASLSAFPATNDVGKIYTAIDTRKIYRWSGTGYVEISASPGTTTDVPEGTNLYYTNARAAAAAPVQSVAGRTGTVTLAKSDVGLSNVPNTDATARANHTGTQTASTISDFETEAAKYGPVTSVSGRTGTVTVAQLGTSGTASSTTFLRGDGQWTAAGGLGADDDIDGGWFYGSSGLSRSITITSPPTNQTASSGAATFGVTAVAEPTGTLSYQWQKSDSAGFAATQRTLPTNALWNSVAYGNGTFAAVVLSSNVAATSTDGITWTQRTLPASLLWNAVTYGNGLFVAVAGSSATAATSADGITWTTRTLPASADWSAVTYGSGTFVAVASSSSIAATSTDGITWTQRALPASTTWKSVVYGNGRFVAVSQSTVAATSTDGVTWTQRTLPANAYWFGVSYGAGTFVAVAYSSSIAATSVDGISWTQRTLPASANWQGIAYGSGMFVAIASGSAIAAISVDGITWAQKTMPTSAGWGSITYGGSTFVSASYNSSIASTITLTGQSDFTNISSANSSTLALTGLTNADDNLDRFRVIVSAVSASSVTSQPATLTVS